MVRPFRIIVLGDSVPWGQGLIDSNKYALQVAAAYGTAPDVELLMLAHSGAVIGASGNGVDAPGVTPEIPVGGPTILNQVAAASNPATVDPVLLNGGINDVSIETILDPLTDRMDIIIYRQFFLCSKCYGLGYS